MPLKTALTALGLALAATAAGAEPPFYSSVTSNDIDYIRKSDPSALVCLDYLGRDRREMPSKIRTGLFADDTYIFEARFTDGRRLPLWADPAFSSEEAALAILHPLAEAIGRLPTAMRAMLDHVTLNKGDHAAHAEDRGRFFTVYDENVGKRIRTHDLSEAVFHESVHATLDVPHASSARWRAAQASDPGFATGYAAENPEREDLAETALLAFAYFTHPSRLPPSVKRHLETQTPDRLAALRRILPTDMAPPGPAKSLCK